MEFLDNSGVLGLNRAVEFSKDHTVEDIFKNTDKVLVKSDLTNLITLCSKCLIIFVVLT